MQNKCLRRANLLLQESPEVFAKECSASKGWSLDPWNGGKNEALPYAKFVQLYCKWLKLVAQMLVHLLRSGVYIQMRNALLVLQAIRKVIVLNSLLHSLFPMRFIQPCITPQPMDASFIPHESSTSEHVVLSHHLSDEPETTHSSFQTRTVRVGE